MRYCRICKFFCCSKRKKNSKIYDRALGTSINTSFTKYLDNTSTILPHKVSYTSGQTSTLL